MAAVIKTLQISTLTTANPYVIGAAPDNLTGYTLPSGTDAARVSGGLWFLSGATETMWLDDTILTGTTIYARAKIGSTASSSSAGVVIADINGTGHEVIFGTTAGNFRVFATLNGKLAGSVLAGGTFATAPVANAWIELSHTGTTLTVKQNGSTLGSVAGITRPTNARAGMSSRGGVLVGMESEYDAAQSVVSINGGSPFTASQTSSSAETLGFTGLPASITSNVTGLTFGGIGGTANAPTFTKSVRTDGAVYPKDGVTATVTFTNGAESASTTIACNKNADETAVIVASPINDDTTCLFGAIYATTGRSAANGDEVYHTVPAGMSDLVVNPDGTMEVTNAGTFDCWVWTAATGVNYYYSVTITESGAVVVPPITRPLGGRPIRSSLGRQIWTITPHATNPVGGSGETKKAYGIKVSGAGTVVIRTEGGDEDVTITLAAGATLPVVVTHVRDTSTATGILGYSIF